MYCDNRYFSIFTSTFMISNFYLLFLSIFVNLYIYLTAKTKALFIKEDKEIVRCHLHPYFIFHKTQYRFSIALNANWTDATE